MSCLKHNNISVLTRFMFLLPFCSVDPNREMVVSTCERLRPIVYSQAVEEAPDNEDERAAIAETINVGTSLFELYLSMQHMAS